MNKIPRKSGVLCTLVLLFSIVTNALAQKISLKDLTVEHLVNPFSIDNPKPRFSWKLVSAIKDTRQNNYEIRLGTTAKIDKAIWNANVSNDQSVLVT